MNENNKINFVKNNSLNQHLNQFNTTSSKFIDNILNDNSKINNLVFEIGYGDKIGRAHV